MFLTIIIPYIPCFPLNPQKSTIPHLSPTPPSPPSQRSVSYRSSIPLPPPAQTHEEPPPKGPDMNRYAYMYVLYVYVEEIDKRGERDGAAEFFVCGEWVGDGDGGKGMVGGEGVGRIYKS